LITITEFLMLKAFLQLGLFLTAAIALVAGAPAQVVTPVHPGHVDSTPRYLDQAAGMTVDEAVELALRNNPELAAMRNEAAAGEALLKQARLRANPSLETGGTRQTGGPDNSVMVQGELPLELGGRRAARTRVAEQELDIRRKAAAEKERQLASEVRVKFGEILAAIFKLSFIEEMLGTATENFDLVAARVTEGRRPPLEQNLEVVELNRIRSMREAGEGTVEVKMFELRNMLGMEPEAPLRLRGTSRLLRHFKHGPIWQERELWRRSPPHGSGKQRRKAESTRT
jgi:cobalt-zinc-cadmium efflux system outer membrane protein